MFKITFIRMEKRETSLEKSKRFHAKCRKSGKNDKAKKKFDEVKKNIAGRIPETTRSENPFKRHLTTHQTKRAFTNSRLS